MNIAASPGSSSCIFVALGLKSEGLDSTLKTDTAFVKLAKGAPGTQVVLHSMEDGNADDLVVPIGHQHPDCPVAADDHLEERPERNVRAASVAVAIDNSSRVLLTRRPASMRSFPRAWVMAGGQVDTTDATLAHTAVRELKEETGLDASPTDLAPPFGLWESAYPTTQAEWRERRLAGARPAHFCIAYFLVAIADCTTPLKLEPNECDCACWVPITQLLALCDTAGGAGNVAEQSFERAPGSPEGPPVPASLLAGVYPNALGEGVGRGHLWALRQLELRTSAERLNGRL